ncbi:hypothetical protein O181_094547 [Austropuccinia psidii MF-1]|uniref:Uncharacterized protein n=1 Tax=Austropuccinia psidii MF-1 TaxID=1389203 RepID=A0A9Q3J345_9BASI|nr:hypothetical protein [Austropuccinia psidii MF-1]
MGSKASTAHGLWNPEAPFGLNPMRPNRAKGTVHQPQRPSGPPGPILAPISTITKMAKTTPGHKLAKKHILATFNPWPLATINSGPEKFPLSSGEDLSFTNVLCTKGFRCGAYMI